MSISYKCIQNHLLIEQGCAGQGIGNRDEALFSTYLQALVVVGT